MRWGPPRSAGRVSIAVPARADFTGTGSPVQAYFLYGNGRFAPKLFYASPARVVADIRRLVGLTGNEERDCYSEELYDAFRASWPDWRPSLRSETNWENLWDSVATQYREDGPINQLAFAYMLWATYLRTEPGFEDPVTSAGALKIVFADGSILPRFGMCVGESGRNVSPTTGVFNANSLRINPFTGRAPAPGAGIFDPWCPSPPCYAAPTMADSGEGDSFPGKKPGGTDVGSIAIAVGALALLVAIGGRK